MNFSKRSIFLILLLGFASSISNAGVQVVSDIDDTIRITDSTNPIDSGYHAFFTKKVFAGTPEEYKALGRMAEMTFVSGSPTFLRDSIEELLDLFQFPSRSVVLKNWFAGEKLFDYKSRVISKMIEDSPSDDFILFGDDTQSDPQVLSGLASKYPNQVKAAYIHRITGKSIPDNVESFVTAFDSALSLYDKGYISETDAVNVGNTLLEAPFKTIIPEFSKVCPTEERPEPNSADSASLKTLWGITSARIQSRCASRD